MNLKGLPILPDQASTYAEQVDAIWWVLCGLALFFTALVFGLLIFFAIRYRRGAKVNRSHPIHGDLRIELIWTIVPLVMSLAIFVWSAKPFASVFSPPSNAREIFVIGKQWMWHIQHSNGIRENNEIHVPVGEPIKLTLISQDVIHDLFIPAFRIKRDAIPGRYTNVWFTATKTGRYHLFCAEYCGTQHSDMVGWVTVMTPSDFQAWLASGGSRNVEMAQKAGQVPTMEANGAALYQQLACGTCHDPDGLQRGPSLTGLWGSRVQNANGQTVPVDATYVRNAIINPKETIAPSYQQIMPSYKEQLNEEQILQLTAYIKSLAVPRPAAKPGAKSAGATTSAPASRPDSRTGTEGSTPAPPPSQERPQQPKSPADQSSLNADPVRTASAAGPALPAGAAAVPPAQASVDQPRSSWLGRLEDGAAGLLRRWRDRMSIGADGLYAQYTGRATPGSGLWSGGDWTTRG
jgi:cytochrome c oxidase subunit 2